MESVSIIISNRQRISLNYGRSVKALERRDCDVLVVGGGAAASRAAYEAKRAYPNLNVLVAVAGAYGTSGSTNLMASESLGINAPFDFMKDGDSADVYYQDMIETGGGLSDPDLVSGDRG